MWDQFSDRNKIIWFYGLIALLVLNLLFLFFLTLPSGRDLEDKDTKIAMTSKAAELAEKYRDTVKANLERIDRAKADIKNFRESKLLSQSAGVTGVRNEIYNITSKERIEGEDIAFGNRYLENYDLTQYSMKIPLRGTYQSLRRFISKVEDSGSFLVIDGVQLKNVEDKRKKQKLELSVTLTTYFVGS
jgi:Tfp pilus assembly protein PilO